MRVFVACGLPLTGAFGVVTKKSFGAYSLAGLLLAFTSYLNQSKKP
jgi:hypothetical protein